MLVSCETCRRSYHSYCLDPTPLSDAEWACPYAGTDSKHRTRSKRTQAKVEQAEHLATERRNSRKNKYGSPLIVDFSSGWVTKEAFLSPPAPAPVPIESARGGKRTSTANNGGALSSSGRRGKRTSSAVTTPIEPRTKPSASVAASPHPRAAHTNPLSPSGTTPSQQNASRTGAGSASSSSLLGTPAGQGTMLDLTSPYAAVAANSSDSTPRSGRQTATSAAAASSSSSIPGVITMQSDYTTEVMMDKEMDDFFIPTRHMLALGLDTISAYTELEKAQLKELESFWLAKDHNEVFLKTRNRVGLAASDLLQTTDLEISPIPATSAEEEVMARSAALNSAALPQMIPKQHFDSIIINGLKHMLGDSNLQSDLLRLLAYQRLEQIYRLGVRIKTYDHLKRNVGVQGIRSEEMPGMNGHRPTTTGPPPHYPAGVPLIFPSFDGSVPVTNFGGIPLEQRLLALNRPLATTLSEPSTAASRIRAGMPSVTDKAQSRAHPQDDPPQLLMISPSTQGDSQQPRRVLFGASTSSTPQSTGRASTQANGTATRPAKASSSPLVLSGTLSDFAVSSPLSQTSGLRVHFPASSTSASTSSTGRKRPSENPEDSAPGTKSAKGSASQVAPHSTPASTTTPQGSFTANHSFETADPNAQAVTVPIAVSNADWEALVDQAISSGSRPAKRSAAAPTTTHIASSVIPEITPTRTPSSGASASALANIGQNASPPTATTATSGIAGQTHTSSVAKAAATSPQTTSPTATAAASSSNTAALRNTATPKSSNQAALASKLQEMSSSAPITQTTPTQGQAGRRATASSSTTETSTFNVSAATPASSAPNTTSPAKPTSSVSDSSSKLAINKAPVSTASLIDAKSTASKSSAMDVVDPKSPSSMATVAAPSAPHSTNTSAMDVDEPKTSKSANGTPKGSVNGETKGTISTHNGTSEEAPLSRKSSQSSLKGDKLDMTPKRGSSALNVSSTPSSTTATSSTAAAAPSTPTAAVVTPNQTPTSTPADKSKEKASAETSEQLPSINMKPAVLYTPELRTKSGIISTAYWTPERLALSQALRTVSPKLFTEIRYREECLTKEEYKGKGPIYGVLLGVINSDNTIISFPLFATNTVGREFRDVWLGELGGTKISRSHATITRNADTNTWKLEVLGKHGVRVNDSPNPANTVIEIKDGDVLMFSSTRLVLRNLPTPIEP